MKDNGDEKMAKIKLARVLVTSLINSTIFQNFTSLVSVLLCHNLDSSMLKCEVYLTNKIFIKSYSVPE